MCCVAPGRTSGSSTVARSAGRTVCVRGRSPTGRGVGELGGDVGGGVAVGPPPTMIAVGVLVGRAVLIGVDVFAGRVPLPLCVGVTVGTGVRVGALVAVGTGVLVGALVAVGTWVGVGVGPETITVVRSPTTPPVDGLQFSTGLGVPVLKSTLQL